MGNDVQNHHRPLALFDSGIGGISILREVKRLLPAEDVLYMADQAHVPYGPRPLEEIRRFSLGIARFLIDQGSKLVVVACNTASAASLEYLRRTFPEVPFVGMEPAVKPAAETTRSGVVGVLATPTTFEGELYASVVERFAEGVRVLPSVLPGLVEQIEAGQFEDETTREILARGIQPLLDAGADTLVLACTHYPFLIPQIREIAGGAVQVIDPSPAIARQAERLLAQHAILNDQRSGSLRFFTSGDPGSMAAQLEQFGFLKPVPEQVTWDQAATDLAAAS